MWREWIAPAPRRGTDARRLPAIAEPANLCLSHFDLRIEPEAI